MHENLLVYKLYMWRN